MEYSTALSIEVILHMRQIQNKLSSKEKWSEVEVT